MSKRTKRGPVIWMDDGSVWWPVSRGHTRIDSVDVPLVEPYAWWISDRGYVVTERKLKGRRKVIRLHVHLTGERGRDHANGNKQDNRRSNLRPATKVLNAANAKRPSTNTSGFKGVTLHRPGWWRAQLHNKGRMEHIGYFRCAAQAHQAYLQRASELWGEYAHAG